MLKLSEQSYLTCDGLSSRPTGPSKISSCLDDLGDTLCTSARLKALIGGSWGHKPRDDEVAEDEEDNRDRDEEPYEPPGSATAHDATTPKFPPRCIKTP